jgi:3',5'-cyclic AMP phosphodiesterase CpdA
MSKNISKQITIIHLSDIHFGETFLFQPQQAPTGSPANATGFQSLLDSLVNDWKNLESNRGAVVVAVTGDLTLKADEKEFTQARDFFNNLVQHNIFGNPIDKNKVFLVPGNHDSIYDEPDMNTRWRPFCSFYRDFYQISGDSMDRRKLDSEKPNSLSRVHHLKELGLIIIEVNSYLHGRKGSSDEHRGQVDFETIEVINKQLELISKEDRDESVKIALVHHHPILLPSFAEPNRGYDAILNAGHLLNTLREYDFHAVLHGHKHYPNTFTYDTRCAWITDDSGPLMLIAGGSVGINSLPAKGTNTYNIVTIKWNQIAKEARIHIETRGLVRHKDNGEDLPPTRWSWKNLCETDRLFKYKFEEKSSVFHREEHGRHSNNFPYETERKNEYKRLRGNMPVIEVIPSLKAGQEYEARVRIVRHPDKSGSTPSPKDIPIEVEWNAGPYFTHTKKCYPSENPEFRAYFAFYGPVLIQAQMKFLDEEETVLTYVYAHMPTNT